ncbi:MAG: hypothetical protein GX616_06140 [Planctomycetes bacterium]|nr:hypothetical protein [Planctomycetota bacterium]
MSDQHDCDSTRQPECLKTVAEIRSVVFGNSHPEKSLLVRMERVETRLAAIQKLSMATLCGVGTLVAKFIGAWIERLIGG